MIEAQAIGATRRTVLALALVCALALASTAWPWLTLHAWLALGALAIGVGVDAFALLRQPTPVPSRELPRRAVAGGEIPVTYRVESTAERPISVELLDELPDDLGGDQRLPPTWIAPGETLETTRRIRTERRGLRPLGKLYAQVLSPLGLLTRRVAAQGGGTLPVLPRAPERRGHRGVSHRSTLTELGIRPRRQRGEGLEFESLREYVLGDDPRHIDWRATARTGRTLVRQHQIERNHRVILAVDTGRLMSAKIDGVSKLDWALTASLALAEASHRSGDAVGLAAFDGELRAFVPPIDSRQPLGALLDASVRLEASTTETSYRALAGLMRARQRKRALVVVLTDFVEGSGALELIDYLQMLARQHCVLLVALRDRLLDSLAEPDPEVEGRALFERLVLQDLEVERQTVLGRLRRAGIHTLDLDPARATAPVLSRYLDIRAAGLL